MFALIIAGGIALISLIGALVFRNGEKTRTYAYAVPVAIGMFLAVVFFELVPETLEYAGTKGSVAVVVGFLLFYVLAHVLRTYHHHHSEAEPCHSCEEDRASASLLLFGDAVHNFADGIVLASAFLVNPAVGVATAIAIALHEVPQEIAEFGVLLRAGYSRTKAGLLNLFSATSIVLGTAITTLFAAQFETYLWVLTGVAAGNLLYIAASDLLPELHEEDVPHRHFFASFVALVFGMLVIIGMITFSHEFIEGI